MTPFYPIPSLNLVIDEVDEVACMCGVCWGLLKKKTIRDKLNSRRFRRIYNPCDPKKTVPCANVETLKPKKAVCIIPACGDAP